MPDLDVGQLAAAVAHRLLGGRQQSAADSPSARLGATASSSTSATACAGRAWTLCPWSTHSSTRRIGGHVYAIPSTWSGSVAGQETMTRPCPRGNGIRPPLSSAAAANAPGIGAWSALARSAPKALAPSASTAPPSPLRAKRMRNLPDNSEAMGQRPLAVPTAEAPARLTTRDERRMCDGCRAHRRAVAA
ncbi:hypothetical protein [Nonomuraea sp. KM90]|uniref:hypothetical protein n=1 Tax=Nonomuraea sp. KM90 TaxID=3457428 RepID=UPI003FCCE77E